MHKLFLAFFIFFFFPPIASAHMGGGPPFVSVNGELAQTNPYYQGTSNINVPQDTLKKSFLPKEEITFTVDPAKLPIPSDVVSESEFSWIFFKGDNFLEEVGRIDKGSSITHTFDTPGSYLVNVYLTYQGDPQLLDTIQVNIVPEKNYVLPQDSISINIVDDTVFFLPTIKIDPKSSLKKSLWDTGDGSIKEGATDKSFKHSYTSSSFISFVYHRVIDSNNLITDTGFQSQGINGKISFVTFPNTPGTPFIISRTIVPTNINQILIAVSSALIIIGTLFVVFRRRAKLPK